MQISVCRRSIKLRFEMVAIPSFECLRKHLKFLLPHFHFFLSWSHVLPRLIDPSRVLVTEVQAKRFHAELMV